MTQRLIFGAGCFWGVQYYFDQVPGVVSTSVGYSGGHVENPTYEQVCTHETGHAEVVLVEFDPEVISPDALLRHFFRLHDPTQLNRQGPDIGDNYRSVIFYYDDDQKKHAVMVRDEVQRTKDKAIVTQILPAGPYFEAETYHQKYAERTGRGMCHIEYAPLS